MYQQITIVGNVGYDANLKYTQSGIAVADFSVATSKNIGSGEDRQQKTTWFRVTCWRNLAEIAGQYVKKGAKILVVGEIGASSYVDRAGVTQVALELTADTFKLLSSREEMENAHSRQTSSPTSGKPRTDSKPPADDNEIPF